MTTRTAEQLATESMLKNERDHPLCDLTPDQLAFIRAAAARWRLDEAGPLMLEALRKAEWTLENALNLLTEIGQNYAARADCRIALESVRAAIAAAE